MLIPAFLHTIPSVKPRKMTGLHHHLHHPLPLNHDLVTSRNLKKYHHSSSSSLLPVSHSLAIPSFPCHRKLTFPARFHCNLLLASSNHPFDCSGSSPRPMLPCLAEETSISATTFGEGLRDNGLIAIAAGALHSQWLWRWRAPCDCNQGSEALGRAGEERARARAGGVERVTRPVILPTGP